MKQIGTYLLSKKGQLDKVPNPQSVEAIIKDYFSSQKLTISVVIQGDTALIKGTAATKNELFIHQKKIKEVVEARYSRIKNIRVV